MIHQFIETHVENLTALALDKWFDNTDTTYIDVPSTSVNESLTLSTQYRDQLRQCLKVNLIQSKFSFYYVVCRIID